MAREIDIPCIRRVLDYDKGSGIFRWKEKVARCVIVGRSAGTVTREGYIVIKLYEVQFRANRLAWAHHYGVNPDGMVDHINGVRSDNRISNLRVVTPLESRQNRTFRAATKSGHVGVRATPHGTWRVTIGSNGKYHRLGSFKDKMDAISAYLQAKAELHTFNPRPNDGPLYRTGEQMKSRDLPPIEWETPNKQVVDLYRTSIYEHIMANFQKTLSEPEQEEAK